MLTCVNATGGALAVLQDVASGVPLRRNPGSQPGSPMTGAQQQQAAAPRQQPAETPAAGQQCLRCTAFSCQQDLEGSHSQHLLWVSSSSVACQVAHPQLCRRRRARCLDPLSMLGGAAAGAQPFPAAASNSGAASAAGASQVAVDPADVSLKGSPHETRSGSQWRQHLVAEDSMARARSQLAPEAPSPATQPLQQAAEAAPEQQGLTSAAAGWPAVQRPPPVSPAENRSVGVQSEAEDAGPADLAGSHPDRQQPAEGRRLQPSPSTVADRLWELQQRRETADRGAPVPAVPEGSAGVPDAQAASMSAQQQSAGGAAAQQQGAAPAVPAAVLQADGVGQQLPPVASLPAALHAAQDQAATAEAAELLYNLTGQTGSLLYMAPEVRLQCATHTSARFLSWPTARYVLDAKQRSGAHTTCCL